jgi:hypothetical protein
MISYIKNSGNFVVSVVVVGRERLHPADFAFVDMADTCVRVNKRHQRDWEVYWPCTEYSMPWRIFININVIDLVSRVEL